MLSAIEQLRVDANEYYDLQAADESVRINFAVRNAQASLRDAQALEQAGVHALMYYNLRCS